MAAEVQMWVIYDHPADFPDHFVVRCTRITGGSAVQTPEVWLRPNVQQARAVIQTNYPGAYRLDRDPADPAHIVEVWI